MQRHAFITPFDGAAAVCRIGLFGLRLLACAVGIVAVLSLVSLNDTGRANFPHWANSAQAATAQHRRTGYATCG